MSKTMNKQKANSIYDVLVTIGGAVESDRDSFIYHHCEDTYVCQEWRFCGYLGFGGKYRSNSNSVTYYQEDETPQRIKITNQLNEALQKIH